MKKRGKLGRFIKNGGTLSEKRDKKCPDCDNFIMRKSTRCRSCSQKGERSPHWKGGTPICPICKCHKSNHSSGLCRNCFRNENHFAWKGDNAGYTSLHMWIKSILGKPNYCEFCKSTEKKRYEWANKSGKYNRDLSDWLRLCKSCHVKYDKKLNSLYRYKYV